MHYFAQFSPVKEGGYSVRFPDVPEAITYGVDIEEALLMAEDALKICLEEYAKRKTPFPVPSTLEQARTKAEEWEADLDLEKNGNDFYQLIPAPDMDTTPVRLSISLPKNVIGILDRKAKLAGMTRSGYIAKLAMQNA